eukprot:COSAG01_NODE_13060_length_1642_cov_3.952690_1_plen_165_part_00
MGCECTLHGLALGHAWVPQNGRTRPISNMQAGMIGAEVRARARSQGTRLLRRQRLSILGRRLFVLVELLLVVAPFHTGAPSPACQASAAETGALLAFCDANPLSRMCASHVTTGWRTDSDPCADEWYGVTCSPPCTRCYPHLPECLDMCTNNSFISCDIVHLCV